MTMLKLLPTTVTEETYAGISYHIDGELVPTLTVNLGENDIIYFEQHVLLWKYPSIQVSLHAMKGAMKRMFAGIQIFITDAQGPGQLSFSRDGVGHIFAIHLKAGESVHVRENQFVAATKNVEYNFERMKGAVNMFFGGAQFFIDKFRCTEGDGILWLHGYGNVFEKHLEPDEQIDIEPGAWLYKSPHLHMETKIQKISTIFVAGGYLVMNRFTGPGRIALQSFSFYQPAFWQNPITAILRLLLFIVIFGLLILPSFFQK